MQLINRIENTTDLKSFRDHVGRTIERRLGSPLKGRKLDEFTADLLGVKDFNTALGLVGVNESIPKGVITQYTEATHSSNANTPSNIGAWVRVLMGLAEEGYTEHEDMQDLLDETVFDFVGSAKNISDAVNNQGWDVQVGAIASQMALSQLRFRVSEITGVLEDDLKRCVAESACDIENNASVTWTPFSVRTHVGY